MTQWFGAGVEARYKPGRSATGVPLARTARKAKGAKPIYVLNGPNLNLLGSREPEVYGHMTLGEIERRVEERAASLGFSTVFRQTNSEGELIGWLQEARQNAAAVVLNGAGLTHTSVALLDAVRALERPLIEVHLSNPYAREDYRRHSFVSEGAKGVICGLGADGYLYAIDHLVRLLEGRTG
jgi:3-dehydroquinate dehydratase-2